jgi:RNA polymerase sigma-70 factor (ECF subfamily)
MVGTRLFEWAKGRRSREDDFETLLGDRRAWVFRLALKIVESAEEAEDVTQVALTAAWTMRGTLRDTQKLDAWLRQIVVRTSLNHLRAHREAAVLVDESALRPSDEESVLVHSTLARMKPEHRALLALAVGEGLSYREMAQALGIPEGTVSSRLNAAKCEFRSLWEAD